jgi:hypothetical protein
LIGQARTSSEEGSQKMKIKMWVVFLHMQNLDLKTWEEPMGGRRVSG